jgi:hypothetical protein
MRAARTPPTMLAIWPAKSVMKVLRLVSSPSGQSNIASTTLLVVVADLLSIGC